MLSRFLDGELAAVALRALKRLRVRMVGQLLPGPDWSRFSLYAIPDRQSKR